MAAQHAHFSDGPVRPDCGLKLYHSNQLHERRDSGIFGVDPHEDGARTSALAGGFVLTTSGISGADRVKIKNGS